jgi:hypothetical protein
MTGIHAASDHDRVVASQRWDRLGGPSLGLEAFLVELSDDLFRDAVGRAMPGRDRDKYLHVMNLHWWTTFRFDRVAGPA